MFETISAIFIILHGLVHLLYMGQSLRKFELQQGITWPDNSWVSGKQPGNDWARVPVAVMCVISASGFAAAGIMLLYEFSLFKYFVYCTSVFSSLLYLLAWDGVKNKIADKGAVGVVINVALIICIYVFY
ncbi:MAG: hypothetical protein JW995_10360 [Melioribacteraceae bacterium]|nr:hypothetical protein [Melioribacteraceae bacterium]